MNTLTVKHLHARDVFLKTAIPLVFNISITSQFPPLCISRQKVMDILSLPAWPLVILFHRPTPRWRKHNGGRCTSSQSIFWQTWSSKLVCFGKGMTKDLFNTPVNQYKDQWMACVVSFSSSFFPLAPCARKTPTLLPPSWSSGMKFKLKQNWNCGTSKKYVLCLRC